LIPFIERNAKNQNRALKLFGPIYISKLNINLPPSLNPSSPRRKLYPPGRSPLRDGVEPEPAMGGKLELLLMDRELVAGALFYGIWLFEYFIIPLQT